MANDINKLFGALTEVIDVFGGLLSTDDVFESKDAGYKTVRKVDLGDMLLVGDVSHMVVGMHGDTSFTTLSLQGAESITLPNDAKVRVA